MQKVLSTYPRESDVRATELIGLEELVEHGDKAASAVLLKAGIKPLKLRFPVDGPRGNRNTGYGSWSAVRESHGFEQ